MKKFTGMGGKRHEEDDHQRNREERKKRGEVRQVKAMICIDEGRKKRRYSGRFRRHERGSRRARREKVERKIGQQQTVIRKGEE